MFSLCFHHIHIFCNIFAILHHFVHAKTKTWHCVTLFIIFLSCFRHIHIFCNRFTIFNFTSKAKRQKRFFLFVSHFNPQPITGIFINMLTVNARKLRTRGIQATLRECYGISSQIVRRHFVFAIGKMVLQTWFRASIINKHQHHILYYEEDCMRAIIILFRRTPSLKNVNSGKSL